MNPNFHKIDADDRKVFEVLNEQKYRVDYFQREYKWEQKHIEQLITDLSSAFLQAYNEGDSRTAIERYNNYYLGPFVVSSKDGVKSIIDGQQRLTSLTLFLIYLNNLQKDLGTSEELERLIFSERYGERSFNIQDEERKLCLESLFLRGDYVINDEDDESTKNMVERYSDIVQAFPEELKGVVFPYFLDWLKYNVILVEITAYNDENAYAIFESMNDRGLNLTSSEMLKGYVLSRFSDTKKRNEANSFWKDAMLNLHSYSKDEDQQFFQSWLRSQYADSIRQGKAGSANEDFEKIGTRFHSWFRDNLARIGLSSESSADFELFINEDMRFFLAAYNQIIDAQITEIPGLEHVFYHKQSGIAQSLAIPLMLSPLTKYDEESTRNAKINLVAKYLEIYVVRRAVNFRKFGASSIRYTMYTLVKELRGLNFDSLRNTLEQKLNEMEENLEGVNSFQLHGMNRNFVKFMLSRITATLDNKRFNQYYTEDSGRAFEIEHLWANKFEEHRDEFEQQHDFEIYRNRIGALVLLPRGTNQSYNDAPYSVKIEHYLKENLYAQSLHPLAYERNPNFVNRAKELGVDFKPHTDLKKSDIDERTALVRQLSEKIWTL